MPTYNSRQVEFIKRLGLGLEELPETYERAADSYRREFRGAQIGRHGIKEMISHITGDGSQVALKETPKKRHQRKRRK